MQIKINEHFGEYFRVREFDISDDNIRELAKMVAEVFEGRQGEHHDKHTIDKALKCDYCDKPATSYNYITRKMCCEDHWENTTEPKCSCNIHNGPSCVEFRSGYSKELMKLNWSYVKYCPKCGRLLK